MTASFAEVGLHLLAALALSTLAPASKGFIGPSQYPIVLRFRVLNSQQRGVVLYSC
jgi:hypothetical protein